MKENQIIAQLFVLGVAGLSAIVIVFTIIYKLG
jgi:hypothetical protein